MKRLTSNVLSPIGPPDALMCFVGEAPGKEENAHQTPFVGPAGQLLNRCFSQVGIVRSQVMIHNVFDQQPPRNKIDYFYEDKKRTRLTWEGIEHVERLRLWLEQLLERRKQTGKGPNVLVALGVEPMKHLTGKRRITKWRGSVLPCTLVPGFKVYCTYHPSFVQRLINEPRERLQGEKKILQQNVLPLFLVDLERAVVQSEQQTFTPPLRRFDTDLSHTELVGYLRKMVEEPKRFPLVGVDIETMIGGPKGPIVWCIGFAPEPDYGFVVPLIRSMGHAWSLEQEAELWYWISMVFLQEKIQKVFQGGLYDLSILGRYYGLRLAKGTYEDTMYCHHANYPYLKKALEVLASIYTWEPYYKDEGRVTLGSRSDEAEFRYNAKDCCVTREILPKTLKDCRELGTEEGYRRTMSIWPSHLGMMLRGVKYDYKRHRKLIGELEEKAAAEQKKVFTLSGYEFNLNSNDDVRRLLYGYYGLELQYHQKTKQVTTDKDALNKLKQKYHGTEGGAAVEGIMEYRKFSKLAQDFGKIVVDVDGRIRTSYSIVSTWRTNSASSPFTVLRKDVGRNLQNIPVRTEEGRLIRKLFVPDEGYVMGASDRRQAEAMVVAYLAGDVNRIRLFEEGFDVHWYNACLIFGIPESVRYDDKTKYHKFRDRITGEEHTLKAYRDIGKRVVHAGNYGMGWTKLQATLAGDGFIISAAVAKAFLESHKANNPLLLSWQRSIKEEVKATRTLISPIGRKRQFLGRFNASLFNAAFAFKPQNTVGELTEITIQRVWERVPKVQLLMNVHDELLFQYREADEEEVHRQIEEASRYPIEINGRVLNIPIDFKKGPSWGELKEI